jgi:hypothetical protein
VRVRNITDLHEIEKIIPPKKQAAEMAMVQLENSTRI